MSKKLSLESVEVSSFEAVAPPREDDGAREKGTVYGFSGQYGPTCRSEWPNCNDITIPWY